MTILGIDCSLSWTKYYDIKEPEIKLYVALRTSQSYTLCTDLPKLRNHPNIEKNTSIVNVIDKYIHKLDIYYKKKNF